MGDSDEDLLLPSCASRRFRPVDFYLAASLTVPGGDETRDSLSVCTWDLDFSSGPDRLFAAFLSTTDCLMLSFWSVSTLPAAAAYL